MSKMLIYGFVSLGVMGCKSRDERMAKLSSELDESIVAPRTVDNVMVIGDTNLTNNRNIASGFPISKYSNLRSVNGLLLSREQFVVSFNTESKIPAWTSWQLVAHDIGSTERSESFQSDKILNTFFEIKKQDLGVTPDDYKGTCFDRGHQAPAADRSNSMGDNVATFYMSNMAPQTSFLNRIIWKSLETYSRKLVNDDGRKLQIYSGTILRDGREGMGTNKDIQVPDSFFKVVAVFKSKTETTPMGYIAVIMPNVTADGLDPLSENATACDEQKHGGSGSMARKWGSYVVPLAELEEKAGLTFPFLKNVAAL